MARRYGSAGSHTSNWGTPASLPLGVLRRRQCNTYVQRALAGRTPTSADSLWAVGGEVSPRVMVGRVQRFLSRTFSWPQGGLNAMISRNQTIAVRYLASATSHRDEIGFFHLTPGPKAFCQMCIHA